MYPQIMKYQEWKNQLHNKIQNLENLPSGLKCNYLILVAGLESNLIAKQWKRKKPQLADNEYLISWK
ncbi:MAG: hypothetical protein ACXADW_21010 [Candidatus Hodarchaeales archaeon]|jgi:hypothetical protein